MTGTVPPISPERNKQLSIVYYIQWDNWGPIKIGQTGWSGKWPYLGNKDAHSLVKNKVLWTMTRGSPVPLKVLATEEGIWNRTEKKRHKQFAALRCGINPDADANSKEWFYPSSEILNFLTYPSELAKITLWHKVSNEDWDYLVAKYLWIGEFADDLERELGKSQMEGILHRWLENKGYI